MSYCQKCGAYIPDGSTKCVACGYDSAENNGRQGYGYGGAAAQAEPEYKSEATRREQTRQQPPPEPTEERGQSYGGTVFDGEGRSDYRRQSREERRRQHYEDRRARYEDRRGPYYYDPEAEDAERNRGWGVLCYLGPLFLIPLLLKPNSSYIRYHANQGLVLFIAELIVEFCAALPVVGWLVSAVGGVMVLVSFISGIMNALNGRRRCIPFFGNINLIK